MKEKYVHLQKMLTVNYKYEIIDEMKDSLRNEALKDKIKNILFHSKKTVYTYSIKMNPYGGNFRKYKENEVDDLRFMANRMNSLFKDLG